MRLGLLQPLVGAAVILGLAYACSNNRQAIRLRAMFADTPADFMTATIAGFLL